jgi:hypothetical protein
LEAVLDKAVHLEDSKKITRYGNHIILQIPLSILFLFGKIIIFILVAQNCNSELYLRGTDLESMSIVQRDALLVFRTLCKVGFLIIVTILVSYMA